jgi:signal transduction histidine kinase/CheY-like chemotaxis protein
MHRSKWSFKIDKKLYGIFITLIIITLLNALVSTYIIDKSRKITLEIAEVTSPSLSAISELNQLVNNSWLQITHLTYQKNKEDAIEEIEFINGTQYPDLKKQLLGLSASWHVADQKELLTVFEKYDQLIYYEETLINKQKVVHSTNNAEELLLTEVDPLVKDLTTSLKSFNLKIKKEANSKQKEMINSFIILMAVVLGLAMIIINFIIIITLFLNKSVVNPLMKIRRYLLQLSKGELPELSMEIPKSAVGEMIEALKSHVEGLKSAAMFANHIGQGNFNYPFTPLSNNDVQGKALLDMRARLRSAADDEASRKWISDGLERISRINRDYTLDISFLCRNLIKEIVTYSGVCHGTLFINSEENEKELSIELKGHFAAHEQLSDIQIEWIKHQIIRNVIDTNSIYQPSQKFVSEDVNSPFVTKCYLIALPLYASGKVVGALEFASLEQLSNSQLTYLNRLLEPVAASIYAVSTNILTRELLDESIKQAEELTTQKQELACVNKNLITKSEELVQSQKELKSQQEELKAVNADLEIKAHLLEERSLAIEQARQALAFKASQLEETNKFKSSFLANMSHELRTPLNSILILAKLLADNKNSNLSPKQVEHASVIHKSGSDLLMLINDILDISKIESGKLEFVYETIRVDAVADDMKLLFREFANDKQIQFEVETESGLFDEITSDKLRLEQVIKNLVSNALKFTDKNGEVKLSFKRAAQKDAARHNILLSDNNVLAITVSDNGIGIPPEKQKVIFDAFKQADNSTSRKYGGTGLGLTICREIVQILGGEVVVESEPGKGSIFKVFLPQHSGAKNGESKSLSRITEDLPIENPSSEVANNSVLKEETTVQKFPDVGFADDRNFITPYDKIVLILEKDIATLKTLIDYCHIYNYKAIASQNGETGLALAKEHAPHAILMDVQLPDMDGWSVLSHLQQYNKNTEWPVHIMSTLQGIKVPADIQVTAIHQQPLTKNQLETLMKNLFVGEKEEEIYDEDYDLLHNHSLKGKTILMADDDMRSIYSLTTIIENAGANLICAYDGKEALNKLQKNPEVDIILMDTLMPVMNGFEAIAELRKDPRFQQIPVLALLQNDSIGDQEKCRLAGASDCLTKPLTSSLLLSKISQLVYQ